MAAITPKSSIDSYKVDAYKKNKYVHLKGANFCVNVFLQLGFERQYRVSESRCTFSEDIELFN